jgi:hypothetical protein
VEPAEEPVAQHESTGIPPWFGNSDLGDETPVPIGEWQLNGHHLRTSQGGRGAVPVNDRILFVDYEPITFEDCIRGHLDGRWPFEVDAAIHSFFVRNENANHPPSLGKQGGKMFLRACEIAGRDGIDAAFAFVGITKGDKARARSERGSARRTRQRIALQLDADLVARFRAERADGSA